jgi:hypothetical protein
MQRLSGLLLLLAGAGLGAYTYLPTPQDVEQKLAEVTRISAAPDRELRPSPPAASTASTSIIASNAHAADGVAKETGAAIPAELPLTTGALSVAQQTGGWTTVVAAESSTGRLTSSKPGDGETRAQLARDLQRELKRVGCYGGEVTGNWSPSTQRAMSAFMDRVNATLPVDEPDYILLTLVQGHTATACGTDCPSGQVLSEGRCVPHAVVAQATRKSEREQGQKLAAERKAAEERRVADEHRAAEDRRVAEARQAAEDRKAAEERKLAEVQKAAEERKVAEQRRAAGELRRVAEAREAEVKAAAVRAEQSEKAEKAAEKKVTVATAEKSAEKEELPWLNGAQQSAAAVSKPEPLPGMMAIGGPRLAAADPAVGVAPVTPPPAASAIPAEIKPAPNSESLPSAAPVLTQPDQSAKRQARPATQGLPGTKSGVTAKRAPRPQYAAPSPPRPRATASVHRSAPRVAARSAPKPKYTYSASSSSYSSRPRRYYVPRAGASHYNMMQAYSGIY